MWEIGFSVLNKKNKGHLKKCYFLVDKNLGGGVSYF